MSVSSQELGKINRSNAAAIGVQEDSSFLFTAFFDIFAQPR